MVQHGAIVAVLVACSPHPRAPATVVPTTRAERAPVDAAIVDAATPVPADAAALDAAPLDAFVACYADPSAVAALPPFRARSAGRVCDLRDRIIVVDGRTVTVLTRPMLRRTTTPIDRTEHFFKDGCDGPGGGHAGCSMTSGFARDRFWSKSLGTSFIELGEFGSHLGNVIEDANDPQKVESCREDDQPPIATCSAASGRVSVEVVGAPSGSCWHLRATMLDAADHAVVLEGDIDAAASTARRWVYRFADVALAFTPTGATLEVAGASEPCVAFAVGT